MSLTDFLQNGLPRFLNETADTVKTVHTSVESIRNPGGSVQETGTGDQKAEKSPPQKIVQHEQGPKDGFTLEGKELYIAGAAIVGLVMLAYVLKKG